MNFEDGLKIAEKFLRNKGCILCNGTPDIIVAFIPNEQHQPKRKPKGKKRICFYPVCKMCSEPARVEEIEDKLIASSSNLYYQWDYTSNGT